MDWIYFYVYTECFPKHDHNTHPLIFHSELNLSRNFLCIGTKINKTIPNQFIPS